MNLEERPEDYEDFYYEDLEIIEVEDEDRSYFRVPIELDTGFGYKLAWITEDDEAKESSKFLGISKFYSYI